MTYLVVTPDGRLHVRRHQPTLPTLAEEAGGAPLARVTLRRLDRPNRPSMCLYTPAREDGRAWPRNPVGAVVAATFGAEQYPYAGPLAFVGWTAPARMHELPRVLRVAVTEVHLNVQIVLTDAAATAGFSPAWGQAARAYARHVVEADGPGWFTEVTDLFGRGDEGRSWWVCPNRGCSHAGMFHRGGRCWFNTCECGKETS